MTRMICSGRLLPHEPIVLSDDGKPGDHVVAGICIRCRMLGEAVLNGITGETLEEYREYLACRIDPRD